MATPFCQNRLIRWRQLEPRGDSVSSYRRTNLSLGLWRRRNTRSSSPSQVPRKGAHSGVDWPGDVIGPIGLHRLLLRRRVLQRLSRHTKLVPKQMERAKAADRGGRRCRRWLGSIMDGSFGSNCGEFGFSHFLFQVLCSLFLPFPFHQPHQEMPNRKQSASMGRPSYVSKTMLYSQQ